METESQDKVIKVFKSFILGKCRCGYCNEDIPIRNSSGYLKKFQHGHNAKGVNNPRYKGSKDNYDNRPMLNMPWHPNSDKAGYIYVYVLKMTQRLGRPLARGEVVHHIDGDVTNNDITNLQLFSSQGEHISTTLKLDTSDRSCSECDSFETQVDKDGHEHWYDDHKDGVWCRRCYCKKTYKYVKKGRKN